MTQNEKPPSSTRELKMLRTRHSLVSEARRLTLERGLNGFTVEELCAEIGISRRTFFNYFATKDDAVLGTSARDPLEMFGGEFVAGGQVPDPADLLTALQELIARSVREMEGLPDQVLLGTIIWQEPAVLQRLNESVERRIEGLAELIARRESLPTEDPFPRLAAGMVSHLVGHTVREYVALHPTPDRSAPAPAPPVDEFLALLARNVDLARTLFTAARDSDEAHRSDGRP